MVTCPIHTEYIDSVITCVVTCGYMLIMSEKKAES